MSWIMAAVCAQAYVLLFLTGPQKYIQAEQNIGVVCTCANVRLTMYVCDDMCISSDLWIVDYSFSLKWSTVKAKQGSDSY